MIVKFLRLLSNQNIVDNKNDYCLNRNGSNYNKTILRLFFRNLYMWLPFIINVILKLIFFHQFFYQNNWFNFKFILIFKEFLYVIVLLYFLFFLYYI